MIDLQLMESLSTWISDTTPWPVAVARWGRGGAVLEELAL